MRCSSFIQPISSLASPYPNSVNEEKSIDARSKPCSGAAIARIRDAVNSSDKAIFAILPGPNSPSMDKSSGLLRTRPIETATGKFMLSSS